MDVDVDTQLVTRLPVEVAVEAVEAVGARARAVGLLGPLTVVAGLVWAILQPYRVTLLHPRGQGFWFLFVEAPLFLIAAGIVFAVFVARPLVTDIEAAERESA